MEQININTTKEKNKHLSEFAIDAIINEYNEFNASVKTEFRKTVKNRQARIPSRNIGKTDFIKKLAIKYYTCPSTIYNVIKDAKVVLMDGYKDKTTYLGYTANAKRKQRKPSNHSKLESSKQFVDMVVKEVKKSKFNSIDETIHDFILNRTSEIEGLTTVCTKTIYNYIHANKIDLKPIELPRMVRRKPSKSYKTYTPKGQRGDSIENRPFEPQDRSKFGNWEGDLVTGPRDGQNGAFLTLIERKTRFYYMIPIKSKKSKNVYLAINKLNKLYGDNFKDIFKSITFDNGSEFARFKDIEIKPGTNEQRTKVYFANPYASSERGSNEKCNQLIRYYIPKGTDINKVDASLIEEVQLGINNKKRKILGYKSAELLFKNELKNNLNLEIDNLYYYFKK